MKDRSIGRFVKVLILAPVGRVASVTRLFIDNHSDWL